jgi:arabinan endo-1,5-alpha-L-arabinosidase
MILGLALSMALAVPSVPTVRPLFSYVAIGMTSDAAIAPAFAPAALLPFLPAPAIAPAPALAPAVAPASALRAAASAPELAARAFDGALPPNPLVEANLPDPAVVRAGKTFYLTGTSNRAPNAMPLLKSKDLKSWEPAGHIFPEGGHPAWTKDGSYFWAPEIHRVGGRYVVYYTAEDKSGKLALGAAWAQSPAGPWTDLGRPMLENPRVGLIDSHFFRDSDGRQYLYWKEDSNGLKPQERTGILARELTADGLGFVGEPVRLLENDLAWEGELIEGPWVVKRGKYYHLLYSANVFHDGRYAVGAARSLSPLGPFVKKGDPVLRTNESWAGPGHGMVLKRGRRWDYIYHAWRAGQVEGSDRFSPAFLAPYPAGEYPRVPMIDRIHWRDNWPVIGDGTPSSR